RIEDLLCAIAVVKIDIEDGNWGLGIGDWGLGVERATNPQSPSPSPQVLRCNRGIIEVAVAAIQISAGVMAGWATECIRQPLTLQQQRGAGQGGIGGGASGAIGASDDWRA